MMKKRMISIFISAVLVGYTSLAPVVTAQATSLVPSLGLGTLLESLVMSVGFLKNGFQADLSTDSDAYTSLLDYFDAKPYYKTASEIMAELDALGSYQEELEAQEDGTVTEFDGFNIVKMASCDYRLQLHKELVDEASNAVKSWANSDDAMVNYTASDALGSYFSKTYVYDYSVLFNDSYDKVSDVSSVYGSDALTALNELGYSDSNCMVVAFRIHPYSSSYFSKLFDSLTLEDKDYIVLMPVAYGDSFMLNGAKLNNSSSLYERSETYLKTASTDFFRNIKDYHATYGYKEAVAYLQNEFSTYDVPCVLLDDSTAISTKMCVSQDFGSHLVRFENLFNAATGAVNDSFLIRTFVVTTNSAFEESISTVDVTAEISCVKDSGYVLDTDDTIEIAFSPTTAAAIESCTDLSEIIAYTQTLSEQLDDLSKVIQDSSSINASTIIDGIGVQTDSLLDGIQAQTDSLLSGFTDAIAGALAAAFVPDLTMWKEELDARVEAIKSNAAILMLPITIITPVLGIFDAESIDDFVLTIPPIEYRGYVLFEGYSFNMNEFLEQDVFSTLHDVFILITDVIILFAIGNYAARKFTTIIEGGS